MLDPRGIAIAVAVVALFGSGWYFGSSRAETAAELTAANKALDSSRQIKKLQADLQTASVVHTTEMQEIRDAWTEAQKAYTLDVAGIRADYEHRLLLSTTRAGIYQRQAKGSASEQERLAAHAAELDRSLEEGRQLVGELKATIGQRDSAIRALGSMILTDRKFFSPE